MSAELKTQLSTALDSFKKNRFKLLGEAQKKGGQALVQQLEAEYDSLKEQHALLLKQQLDSNLRDFKELVNASIEEVARLQQALQEEDTQAALSFFKNSKNLVGKINELFQNA